MCFTSFRNRLKNDPLVSFSVLFRNECKFILDLPIMYGYCVYPVMSKSPKQLPNCMEIAGKSVVVIVFSYVLCDVRGYTVTVFYCRST